MFEVLAGSALMRSEGLTFQSNGVRLLDDVSISIREKRRLAIMGANGAGKSLLLRLLHGLLPASAGKVLFSGAPMGPEAIRAQAMVFQRPVLLRRSTLANLRFALKARGVRGPEQKVMARAALERAGLSHLAHRPARVLSGGEQQRLALVRALAVRPRLLFLDEPTASLDPGSTAAIEQMLLGASAEGVTVVLVTHDIGQARRLGEDAIFLHQGRVAEAGLAQDVLQSPTSAPARAFLSGQLYLDPGRFDPAEERR